MHEIPELNPEPKEYYYPEKIEARINEILEEGILKNVQELYPRLARLNPHIDAERLGYLMTLKIAEAVYIAGLTSKREKFFEHPKWKETAAIIREEVKNLEPRKQEIIVEYLKNKEIWKSRGAEEQ